MTGSGDLRDAFSSADVLSADSIEDALKYSQKSETFTKGKTSVKITAQVAKEIDETSGSGFVSTLVDENEVKKYGNGNNKNEHSIREEVFEKFDPMIGNTERRRLVEKENNYDRKGNLKENHNL